MFSIHPSTLDMLRKKYPRGTRVKLDYMQDPWSKLNPGDKGTVLHVDDIGTVHVAWDCGSSLGVVYGEDSCTVLKTVTTVCYGETRVWDSREEAEDYFLEAMIACDGSEKERYCNIYLALKSGETVCKDEL